MWEATKGLGFIAITSILLFWFLHALRRASKETRSTLLKAGPEPAGYRLSLRKWPGTGRCATYDPAAQALTGYAPATLVGNAGVAYADLIHPEDRERAWEQVQKALTKVVHSRSNIAFGVGRTSAWIWEQGDGVPDMESKGRMMLEGLILDVTELKQAEAAARRERPRWRPLAMICGAAPFTDSIEMPAATTVCPRRAGSNESWASIGKACSGRRESGVRPHRSALSQDHRETNE